MMRAHGRLAALVAAVALVAGACGGGNDEEVSSRGTTSSSSSSTTTSTNADAEAGDAATGDESSADAPVDAGSSGETGESDGSGGDAGPRASEPDAPQPIAAGLFEYDTSGQASGPSGSEEFSGVTTLEVERPDGARQRSVRDLRDEEGNGTVTTMDVLYRDDGVYLEYLKLVNSSSTFGTQTFEFEFDPPELVLPTNPEVGFHTEFSARSNDGSINADIALDLTGEETLDVGGTPVETLTTKTVITFSGSFDGESTWNDNIDPERFLIVREDRTSDVEVGVSKFHTEYVATLRNLSPK